ncbi:DUF1156 domain-containing protein [Actinotalea sp. JY-7876]|uniref:DUF1156 domain-containing protein n=1 Tax=Actinotalea sp. JY-7876 TaxID=2758442 RepID=UPI0015F69C74|nr:DUF1156 domain-containing protein [Actinotalea sp. JY-7876]
MTRTRKLIDVSRPLEDTNHESAGEKSVRHGRPSTPHLWWARRPLAAARAVRFAPLIDDPSSNPDRFPIEEDRKAERERLHNIIRRLDSPGPSSGPSARTPGHSGPTPAGLTTWSTHR